MQTTLAMPLNTLNNHPSAALIPAQHNTPIVADEKTCFSNTRDKLKNVCSKLSVKHGIALISVLALSLFIQPSVDCVNFDDCLNSPLNFVGSTLPWWMFLVCGGLDFVLMNFYFAFNAWPQYLQAMQKCNSTGEKVVVTVGILLATIIQCCQTLITVLGTGGSPMYAAFAFLGQIPTMLFSAINLKERDIPYWISQGKSLFNSFAAKSEEEKYYDKEFSLYKKRIQAGMSRIGSYPNTSKDELCEGLEGTTISKRYKDDYIYFLIELQRKRNEPLSDEHVLTKTFRLLFSLGAIGFVVPTVLPLICATLNVIGAYQWLNLMGIVLSTVIPQLIVAISHFADSHSLIGGIGSPLLPSIPLMLYATGLQSYIGQIILMPMVSIGLTYAVTKLMIEGFNSLFDVIKNGIERMKEKKQMDCLPFQLAPIKTVVAMTVGALTAALSYVAIWSLLAHHAHFLADYGLETVALTGTALFHLFSFYHAYSIAFKSISSVTNPVNEYLFDAIGAGKQELWGTREQFNDMVKHDSAKCERYGITLFGSKRTTSTPNLVRAIFIDYKRDEGEGEGPIPSSPSNTNLSMNVSLDSSERPTTELSALRPGTGERDRQTISHEGPYVTGNGENSAASPLLAETSTSHRF